MPPVYVNTIREEILCEYVDKIGIGDFLLSCKRKKAQAYNQCINICNVISSVRGKGF
jgi:hypothetical protein